jgi:uncharacterized protein (TIGR00297 family)
VPEDRLENTRKFKAADMVALGSAAAILVVYGFLRGPEFSLTGSRFLSALGITATFALLAWFAGGVNWSGALGGSAVAFIMAVRDPRMFLALTLVFALTLAATRVGHARKQQLRTAEPPGGRSASQALANLGIATLVVAIAHDGWQVLALAALAEAAADTVSSEIGMAFSGKTVLITTWKPAPIGMDGGISLFGTMAACFAAAMMALVATISGLVSIHHAAAIVYAGVLGTLVDSLLGALFERRGWLNNDLVNLLSTAAAVGIAWLLL